jgi:hypothetical protein
MADAYKDFRFCDGPKPRDGDQWHVRHIACSVSLCGVDVTKYIEIHPRYFNESFTGGPTKGELMICQECVRIVRETVGTATEVVGVV